jgi:hypothetical protein
MTEGIKNMNRGAFSEAFNEAFDIYGPPVPLTDVTINVHTCENRFCKNAAGDRACVTWELLNDAYLPAITICQSWPWILE